MRHLFAESGLKDIIEKVEQGQRLDRADGVRLMESVDLPAVGYMADLVRRRKTGDYAYFTVSRDQVNNRTDNFDQAENTATMLYGQGETAGERVDRLISLREVQDSTGRFLAFIPLAVQTTNNRGGNGRPGRTTGYEDLKVLSVARIILDNFDHIKTHWVSLGPKLAQVSLSFGADDIDGAGEDITKGTLVNMIKAAGRKPAERDNLYRIIEEVF